MPLRASVDGLDKTSIFYSDDEWNSLIGQYKKGLITISLPCCSQKGVPKTSSNGLKHFAHSKGENSCDSKTESQDHLAIKADIITACEDNQWTAISEYYQNGWYTDVFAYKGDMKLAFEIPMGKQSSENMKIKQDKFLEDNVRGCWLFRTIPKEYRLWKDRYKYTKEIPFFKILKGDSGKITVENNNRQFDLYDFIAALLTKKFKFCKGYSTRTLQEITVTFFDTTCWKCGKPQHLYTIGNTFKTKCETYLNEHGSMWDDQDVDKHPNVVQAVQNFLLTDIGKNLKIGEIKSRYSGTVENYYQSFGCYYCDTIFGDFHLRTEKMYVYQYANNISFSTTIAINIHQDENEHWCYNELGDFCE